ncbi:MAG TPA: SDR family oxidoreductase [Gallionella sp.]|nr:SDR family oxidoreductase [Gallionella sp.]
MNNAITRWLVTGASGFVGRHLCGEIIKRGWQAKAALRTQDLLQNTCDSVIVGQIDGQTDWNEALRDIDVVVHLAARVHVMRDDAIDPLSEFRRTNVAGTAHLARCAAVAGVKRLLYVSSIKVNGESTSDDAKFTEAGVPSPQDAYGISKMEAEQALHGIAHETGMEVVIVRPPLVYGAGVKGNFAQLLKVLAKGIPLPLASVHNLRSMIYVDNLVDALIICATNHIAAGQTYLVSDDEDISTPDLLRQLGAMMGFPARLFHCPASFLKLAGRLTGKSDQIERLSGSLQIDSSKIRRELDWTPPYSLRQGLRATAEWYCSQHLHASMYPARL